MTDLGPNKLLTCPINDGGPMNRRDLRYPAVSRRSMLKSAIGVGTAALLGACVTGDEDVFGGARAGSQATTALAATTSGTTTSGSPTTTAVDSTVRSSSSSSLTTTEAPLVDGGLFPAGGEVIIGFGYEQGAGGKNVPPYVAVWVESSGGELVETIALWFEKTRKGPRWLPDLKRWFTVDQQRVNAGGADTVDAISSATRLPGVYTLQWAGNADGDPVPLGDYFLCIESARERGPYSLIREPISLTSAGFQMDLPDNGELVNATVELRV